MPTLPIVFACSPAQLSCNSIVFLCMLTSLMTPQIGSVATALTHYRVQAPGDQSNPAAAAAVARCTHVNTIFHCSAGRSRQASLKQDSSFKSSMHWLVFHCCDTKNLEQQRRNVESFVVTMCTWFYAINDPLHQPETGISSELTESNDRGFVGFVGCVLSKMECMMSRVFVIQQANNSNSATVVWSSTVSTFNLI